MLRATSVELDDLGRPADVRASREPAAAPPRSLIAAYRTYYESGLYDLRYPRPNPRTSRVILAEVARRGPFVLDFGCGSGRYAAAIVGGSEAKVVGYDPCPAAIAQLHRRHADLLASGRLVPISGSLENVVPLARTRGGFDLVVATFGVLAHIPGASARRATLLALAQMLRPGGAIVLGLPNVARRFRREQRTSPGAEAGDVLYERQSASGPVPLYYHLYRVDELASELAAAGLRASLMMAESVLPERMVVSSRAGALADRLAAACAPLGWAYGFLLVAERAGAAP